MARIFHQNMLRYGAGNGQRHESYTRAFRRVRYATGEDYIIAGFTELTNANEVLRCRLPALARELDHGLTQFVAIAIGVMAEGRAINRTKRPEYVGIAWDPRYVVVEYVGRVTKSLYSTDVWDVHAVQTERIEDHSLHLPYGEPIAGDVRGVGYIAGWYNRAKVIVGFVHNMCRKGMHPTVLYNKLPAIAGGLRKRLGGEYANAHIVFGGDFNLLPAPLPKSDRPGPQLHQVAARHQGGARDGMYIETTETKPLDYWVVNRPELTDANAEVHVETRIEGCSDHAAVALIV